MSAHIRRGACGGGGAGARRSPGRAGATALAARLVLGALSVCAVHPAASAQDGAPARGESAGEAATARLFDLARDASDSAVLVGLPTTEQRARARRVAAEILASIAASPVTPTRDAEAARAAFVRARASLLLGADAPNAESRREACDVALSALEPLAPDTVAGEAAVRLNLGLAMLLRAGEGDAAAACEEFESVLALAEETRAAADPARRVDPLVECEAWVALAQATWESARAVTAFEGVMARFAAARRSAPFAAGGRADPRLVLLTADGAARALREVFAHTADERWMLAACREQTDLLARADLPLDAATLEPRVDERLLLLTDDRIGDDRLPPDVVLRRGRALARRDDRLAEARATLLALLDRPGAEAERPEALWLLAELDGAQADPEQRANAVRFLAALLRDHPGSPRAREAARAALARAAALRASEDEATSRIGWTVEGEALEAVVGAGVDRDLSDACRVRLAERLFTESGGRIDRALADRVLTLLEPIEAGSAAAAGAREAAERAGESLIAADDRELRGALAADAPARVRGVAADRLVPSLRRVLAQAERLGSPRVPALRLLLAEARLHAGDAVSSDELSALLADRTILARPDGPARVHLALGRAMLRGGDAAGAFAELRAAADLFAQVPPPPGAARPEGFWFAWTLMLEILAGQNADGSRSAVIRSQIAHLELIDPGLGGEPWATRIGRVRAGAR